MNVITEIDNSSDDILFRTELKHLKFQRVKNEFIVTLVDEQEYEILKGYGNSVPAAINDLHSNLL